MKKLLLLIVLLFPISVFAEPLEWNTTDKVSLAAAIGTLSMDWATTHWASERWCDPSLGIGARGCVNIGSEANTFLGRFPSTKDVNRHFIITTLGVITFAEFLPNHLYRDTFLLSLSVSEGYIAYHNSNSFNVNWVMKY